MNDTPKENLLFHKGPQADKTLPLETLVWQIGGPFEHPLELADKGHTLIVRDVRNGGRDKVINYMKSLGLELY